MGNWKKIHSIKFFNHLKDGTRIRFSDRDTRERHFHKLTENVFYYYDDGGGGQITEVGEIQYWQEDKAPFYKKNAQGEWYDVNGNADFIDEVGNEEDEISISEMLRVCIDQYANNNFYLSLKSYFETNKKLSEKQLKYLKQGYKSVRKFNKKLQERKDKHQWVTTLKQNLSES